MKKIAILAALLVTTVLTGSAPAADRGTVLARAGGAQDAVAVIVHPMSPVRMLTTAQLRDIFTRKVRGWHMAGGNHELSIRPIIGGEASPSREIFRQRILAGRDFQECEVAEGEDRILQAVAGDEAAVGVVSLSAALHQRGVRIVAVNSEKAALDNPEYPLLIP